MELEHHFSVPVSIEETWAAFNDPQVVAPCFPGATLTSVDGDEFSGSAKIKLGPIAMQYSGSGTYVERDDKARRAVIQAMGRDKRGNGTATATVTAQLSPDGSGTAVHVTTDLAVTGKPAQFGRGVIQDVSDKLLLQFVACLQTSLGTSDSTPAFGVVSGSRTPAQATAPALPAQGHEPTYAPAVDSLTAAPAGGPALLGPAAESGELNLLTTIGRVLLTRYAARALGPVALIAGYLLGRRSGRRQSRGESRREGRGEGHRESPTQSRSPARR